MNERPRSLVVAAVVGLVVGGAVVVVGSVRPGRVDERAREVRDAVQAVPSATSTVLASHLTPTRSTVPATDPPKFVDKPADAPVDTGNVAPPKSEDDVITDVVRLLIPRSSYLSRVSELRGFAGEPHSEFVASLRDEVRTAGLGADELDRVLARRGTECAELRAALDTYESEAARAVENALVEGLLERHTSIEDQQAALLAKSELTNDTVVVFQHAIIVRGRAEYLSLVVPVSDVTVAARRHALATAERLEQVLRGDLGL